MKVELVNPSTWILSSNCNVDVRANYSEFQFLKIIKILTKNIMQIRTSFCNSEKENIPRCIIYTFSNTFLSLFTEFLSNLDWTGLIIGLKVAVEVCIELRVRAEGFVKYFSHLYQRDEDFLFFPQACWRNNVIAHRHTLNRKHHDTNLFLLHE